MSVSTMLHFSDADEGIPVEEFTDQEAEALGRYVTNTESNIFAWKVGDLLGPEQAGALLSRYSRTTLTGRRLLLKEFIPNSNRGREFFEAWLVDYGDDSIQEMAGGLPLSCEFISMVACKEIEDSRIGSYIEKSTRYVPFDKKMPNGEYMFYRDPDIMNSRYSGDYLDLMNSLFSSYSKYLPIMAQHIREINPLENQKFRLGDESVSIHDAGEKTEERYGVTYADLNKAYENSVKASALDLMRDYLPLSTLSHVGISMNARSYEYLILKLLSSPMKECRWVASRMDSELSKVVPSLLKRVSDKQGDAMRDFLSGRNANTSSAIALARIPETEVSDESPVSLSWYTGIDSDAPDNEVQISLLAPILYRFGSTGSMAESFRAASAMAPKDRMKIISSYVGERLNRRHKPGRAFENSEYLFDLRGRIGIFRDLQRHRIGTQERQIFGTRYGYNTRKEYDSIGIRDDYEDLMGRVIDLYGKISNKMPFQAQYAVTFGFDARWYYRANARQLFHLFELRTLPGGHPDYRNLVKEMYHKVREVHPSVANYMKFVNLGDKTLGRLDSEVRIAVKRAKL